MFLMLVMTACIYNIFSAKQNHAMATNVQLALRLHLQQLHRERVRAQELRMAETLGYGRPAKISEKVQQERDEEEAGGVDAGAT